ncbi:MAG: zinc ribbon domain-containing protein [Candidatus Bathyarchaeota archaeon]
MSSYKKPCKYCGQLVPPNSNVCPLCGKVNPLENRCPKCRALIQTTWLSCGSCGLSLRIKCPKCGKDTFFGDYCENCGNRLTVECNKCHTTQAPINNKCIKCGKPL